jgi:putative flippase GtrA
LQTAIYRIIGEQSSAAYATATALTYVPLVFVNFLVQRTWIFKRSGLFRKFVVANLAIMVLVSLLSPFCRQLIAAYFGTQWGDRGGFILAALLGSIPSFLVKRHWVFRE